eukprot:9404650-Ditylum_brightwellii.AAC.1
MDLNTLAIMLLFHHYSPPDIQLIATPNGVLTQNQQVPIVESRKSAKRDSWRGARFTFIL